MKLRTTLGIMALLAAVAIPATSYGQRNASSRSQSRNYFGSGPFQPSNLLGNGYRQRYGVRQYRGNRAPVRIGGIKVYFPPRRNFGGGGYGYSAPVYGYPYGYSPYYATPFRYGYFYPY